MEDIYAKRIIYSRFAMLNAALAVLAVVLLFTMDFSLLIAGIGVVMSVAGVISALISMKGDKINARSLIALIICAVALIVVLAMFIFALYSPDFSWTMFNSTSSEVYLD